MGKKGLNMASKESYDSLSNLPSINGVTLEGDLTTQQLNVDKHFKGWWPDLATLKAAITATAGDAAYVKDASPAITWSIYVYDSTASSNNYWADSGTDADTSNVQTFASGEEVNETYIDDTHLVNPADGALPTADDALQLKAKLDGVTASETKVQLVANGDGQNVTVGQFVSGETGQLTTPSSLASSYAWFECEIGEAKRIRFLAGNRPSDSWKAGYSLGYYDGTTWKPIVNGYFDVSATPLTNEVIINIDDDTITHFRTTCQMPSDKSLISTSNFYCYLQRGESVVDIVEGLNDKIKEAVTPERKPSFSYDGYIKYTDGTIGGSSTTYHRTYFVGLKDYTNINYALKGVGNVAAMVAFFDKNRTYLQSISIQGNGNDKSGSIDLTQSAYQNARYARFSETATGSGDVTLYNRFALNYRVNDLDARVSALEDNEGLKVLIFGDSITDNMRLDVNDTTNCSEYCAFRTSDYEDAQGHTVVFKKWPQLLAEFFKTNEVRNYARSGASYKDQPEYTSGENRRRSLSYQITVAENDLTNPNGVFPTEGNYNPDIVIFALGTNDGNPNDTFDTAKAKTVYNGTTNIDISATLAALDLSKFHEAVMYAFLKTKSMFPTALFLCVLPIQRWANSSVMGELHTALKDVANYFSIPVIDGAYEMGVAKYLEVNDGLGELLKDGLHPNEKGQNVYARMMISQVKSRFVNMDSMNQ